MEGLYTIYRTHHIKEMMSPSYYYIENGLNYFVGVAGTVVVATHPQNDGQSSSCSEERKNTARSFSKGRKQTETTLPSW